MTILRDMSIVWAMVHVLILFAFFYESRCSQKKTLILSCAIMIPIAALNFIGVLLYGPELMGQLLILTCTVPSIIFFFAIAKNRNWKFLFTFCVVDTLSYEVLAISRIIDYFLCGDKYIAMFIIRLVAFPLMEWLAYKYLRKPFLEMKRTLKKGWATFTVVTVVYYVLIVLINQFPTMIIHRPEDVPAVLLVLLLMPLTYFGFFIALRKQMQAQNYESRYQILGLQTQALDEKMEEIRVGEENLRILRHDMRHTYSVIGQMLKEGKTEDALQYINETKKLLTADRETTYCSNPIINAVLKYHVRKAEENHIKTEMHIAFPKEIDVNVTELSVVIANVFENAIGACMDLPEAQRYIKCQSIASPQFIFRISNTFTGKVAFDEKGLPRTDKAGHGTGVYSIATFCEKYNMFYEFKIENDVFIFNMIK